MSSQGEPWWSKLLLYGSIVVSGVAVVGYTVYSLFMGPANTYKDMWNKQYDALLKKMTVYTNSNPDGWTAAQQQNVIEEEKILAPTTKGLADASKGVYDLGQSIIIGLTAIGISSVVASAAVAYLKNRSGGQIRTAQGATYAAIMSYADTMAAGGYPAYATNMVNVAQSMFQAYDLPYMQQTASTLQSQLAYLTGIELIVAQQMIEALTVEIAAIPVWLSLPLPLPLPV